MSNVQVKHDLNERCSHVIGVFAKKGTSGDNSKADSYAPYISNDDGDDLVAE